jgi:hypothetical protein
MQLHYTQAGPRGNCDTLLLVELVVVKEAFKKEKKLYWK